MNIYLRIQQLCEEHNCTISDVASKSKLSTHVIYDWRDNKVEPTCAALNKVCNFFHITIGDFFNTDDDTLSSEQKVLLEKYNSLNKNQKTYILELIAHLDNI